MKTTNMKKKFTGHLSALSDVNSTKWPSSVKEIIITRKQWIMCPK